MSTFPDDASSRHAGWDPSDDGTQPLATERIPSDATGESTSSGIGGEHGIGDEYGIGDEPSGVERALPRPTGPSWGTVAFGLVCLVVAGGALLVEVGELTLDWGRAGPLGLVGVGVLLVLVGLAALVRRGDEEDR